MKDWNSLKQRYLSDATPTQMGGIAANLSRIKTLSQKAISCKTVEYLMQESKYFMEWVAKDLDIEIAAELVEIQRQLVRWQMHWVEIWGSPEERKKVADRSQLWAERILELSGLL
jgi:hypothetical protein